MTALMWAMILAYTLQPLQKKFTAWFRGSRTLAACFVTLTMTVVLAGPIVLIGFTVAEDGKDLAQATRKWLMATPGQVPTWISDMPLVGEEVSAYWLTFAEDRNRWMDQLDKEVKPLRPRIVVEEGEQELLLDPPPIVPVVEPVSAAEASEFKSSQIVVLLGQFLSWLRSWLISVGFAVGRGVTQILLSAFLAFFMLRDAPILSDRLAVIGERLAGERGQHLIKVAGDTVRGVIYGFLGTAIAQALVAGLGFWFAGVPGAVLLAVLTFFFAVIPFGPPVVWLPAALWLFAQSNPGMGIFMLVYGIFVISGVDNFLRPYLISQGSKMPFILIFCGVVGGALAFGLVGVFLGPTMLAVAFRLIEEWSSHRAETSMVLTGTGQRALIETDEVRPSKGEIHGSESIGVG